MARWNITKRKTRSQTPLHTVSRSSEEREVVLGAVKSTVHEILIDIVMQMEPGDSVVTPEGEYFLMKPRVAWIT